MTTEELLPELVRLKEEIAQLQQRCFALEMQAMEQESIVQGLEESNYKQQKQILDLEYKLKVIVDHFQRNGANSNIAKESEETPPPHY